MNRLYFVTGNKNKFEEAKHIIPELEQLDIDLTEIQTLDPKELIKHKLIEAQKNHSGALVVEDQYMDIKCLNGLPGTFIKWFLKTLDVGGIADLVHKYEDHRVTVSVILGYSDGEGKIEFFEGSVDGNIVQPRGTNGFGWDPIFEIQPLGKTFAEIKAEEKANKYSMRKIAFEKLKKYLETQ